MNSVGIQPASVATHVKNCWLTSYISTKMGKCSVGGILQKQLKFLDVKLVMRYVLVLYIYIYIFVNCVTKVPLGVSHKYLMLNSFTVISSVAILLHA